MYFRYFGSFYVSISLTKNFLQRQTLLKKRKECKLQLVYNVSLETMAALAANAVKSQRRKAANKLAEQALSNINEQRQFLATVAQKHRDSLSSVSTLDSYRQYEVKYLQKCGSSGNQKAIYVLYTILLNTLFLFFHQPENGVDD